MQICYNNKISLQQFRIYRLKSVNKTNYLHSLHNQYLLPDHHSYLSSTQLPTQEYLQSKQVYLNKKYIN